MLPVPGGHVLHRRVPVHPHLVRSGRVQRQRWRQQQRHVLALPSGLRMRGSGHHHPRSVRSWLLSYRHRRQRVHPVPSRHLLLRRRHDAARPLPRRPVLRAAVHHYPILVRRGQVPERHWRVVGRRVQTVPRRLLLPHPSHLRPHPVASGLLHSLYRRHRPDPHRQRRRVLTLCGGRLRGHRHVPRRFANASPKATSHSISLLPSRHHCNASDLRTPLLPPLQSAMGN